MKTQCAASSLSLVVRALNKNTSSRFMPVTVIKSYWVKYSYLLSIQLL